MGDGKWHGEARTASPEDVAHTFFRRESHTRLCEGVDGNASPPPMADEAPEPRYHLIRELGRGGMGRVDEVFDRALGRPVAQKAVLPGHGALHATLLVAEAQTCAQLEHPSILPVYEIGADAEGNPHYTMRVVRGRTLREVLADTQDTGKAHKSLAELLGILRQVCMAVDFAHSRGVIHCDLKPENVIVGEFGEVYVLDWGVAHLIAGSDVRRASHESFTAGSPGYMAPEQALGGEMTPRTDVFALGVLLYEVLAGARPFDDADVWSVRIRAARSIDVPPSRRDPARKTPRGFDSLVVACLAPDASARPSSARFVADAIDRFLDGARARAEREKEADSHAAEGTAAREKFESLDAEAQAARAAGDVVLARMARWESAERKDAGWSLLAKSRKLAADAARELAHAETAFTRALGRVVDHAPARSGLAALYYREFESAEARADSETMARYLDLAREYDDGALALELAGRGELSVALISPSATPVELSLARYESNGLLLSAGEKRMLGPAPVNTCLVTSGSYVVTARTGLEECRFPILIERARTHHVRLRAPKPGEIPEGMVLIPGGPALLGHGRGASRVLLDFALARFPVTFRDYARFLTALSPEARRMRTPRAAEDFLRQHDDGSWRLHPDFIEGDARARVPAERELDLPVNYVSWYDAAAYASWLAETRGVPFRLPTDVEWEKAMRGADGRIYPMGDRIDPSFAKLRESRAEASQPEPIGAFPLDESPYGVRDLAGGVGDWTSTMEDGGSPPDLAEEGNAGPEARAALWRGGAWSITAMAPTMRFTQLLHHRVGWVGFRLALSLDAPESSSVSIESMRRP